jgi:hypothetical protein
MMMIRAAFVLLAVAAVGDVRPSVAEIYRPWCVQYVGSKGDDGTTCTFTSYEQCMLTARGAGAVCVQNPWYLQYGSGQPGPGQGDRPKRR